VGGNGRFDPGSARDLALRPARREARGPGGAARGARVALPRALGDAARGSARPPELLARAPVRDAPLRALPAVDLGVARPRGPGARAPRALGGHLAGLARPRGLERSAAVACPCLVGVVMAPRSPLAGHDRAHGQEEETQLLHGPPAAVDGECLRRQREAKVPILPGEQARDAEPLLRDRPRAHLDRAQEGVQRPRMLPEHV